MPVAIACLSSKTFYENLKDLLDGTFLLNTAQSPLIWRPLLNLTLTSSTYRLTAARFFACWEPEVASHST
jgi:hypothetical protein